MSDKLIKAMARGGNVRVLMIKSTDLINEVRLLHDTHPTVTAALGRLMNISLMMGYMLKEDEEKLIVEVRGENKLKHMLVNTDNKGRVRATVSDPHIFQVNTSTGKLDVGGIIAPGTLKVSKEINGKLVYTSLVDLQSGEIGDDFAYYFAQSEQIPSAVSVGVLVDTDLSVLSSGGILIQILPTATEEDIEAMETLIASMKPVSDMMEDKDIYEVFTDLFEDGVILGTQDISYSCGCNREQMKDVLRSLSKDDLMEMIEEDNGTELVCHYCHKHYRFDANELQEILDQRN